MKDKIKKLVKNKIFISIVAILFPFLLEVIVVGKISIEKQSLIRIGYVYAIYLLIGIFYILSKHSDKVKKAVDFIMKHRYIIAAIALVILVLFNINFSSLKVWCGYLNEPEQANVLIGKERGIRSDEWLTQSSFMIGQATSEDGFQVQNANVEGGNGNMLMTSAPVSDIVEISRPLLWGFHFLDAEHGFSFYWSLKMIALIMVSIEIIKKITKGDNLLSLAGGLLLGLAPAMVWWLSTAVVDGYIYGMAVVILFSYYMNNLDWKLWKKSLLALGILICLPGFVFMLYPAFQVPFGFFMLIVMLYDFIKNRKALKKHDYVLMGITIIASIGLVVRFLLLSWQSIQLMMNTVYPGHRVDVGGNFITDNMITYFVNIFFPFTNRIANTCEPSTHFYSFIGLVIVIIALIKDINTEKKKENFGLIVSLIGLYVVYLVWEFIGFTEILAKFSLLSFSPAQRTNIVLGILGVILTVVMLQKISKNKKFTKAQGITISLCVVMLSIVLIKQSIYKGYFDSMIKYEVVFTIVFAITYFLIMGKKKHWAYTMFIIAMISGATVNPIAIGIAPLNKTEISNEIRKISEEDKEALWIGESNLNGQYLIANDIKCLNGVNTCPNFKWLNIVDPEKEYCDIYNRFAHISIKLGEKTEFNLIAADAYEASLTYKNIKDLGAKYYFSSSKMSEETMKNFNLEEKYVNTEKSQYIYLIK